MNPREILWDGEFATYPLADISGKTVELLSPQRENSIRERHRTVRSRVGQLLLGTPEDVRRGQEMNLLQGIECYYPVSVRVVKGYGVKTIDATQETAFGYVVNGPVFIYQNEKELGLCDSGKYFALNGFVDICGNSHDATAVIINRKGYRRPDDIGNASEQMQMEYLNGNHDACLTPPDRNGAPCTNLLVVNPGTVQDSHMHPSDRIGVVIDGGGICSTRENTDSSDVGERWKSGRMRKGDLFLLPAGKLHTFSTSIDESLTVFTFHPDSVTDNAEENPMLLGTIRSVEDAKEWMRRNIS